MGRVPEPDESKTGRHRQWTEAEAVQVRAALARMLASPIFSQAERLQRLLRFLVAYTLEGRADLLKGYTIGVEVFDRDASFDPGADSIVRVEAGRLRAKLREYYDTEGASDPIRLELPKGTYAVRVERLAPAARSEPGARPAPSQAAPAGRKAGLAADPRTEDKPSLAVLPFANMSSDPEQGYFADGITEDLTTEFSKLSGLFVISRHTAFAFKGAAMTAQDIGRRLGVRYLLEGSVRRADDKVRITAELVDADSGLDLWAERYDRELEDIFAVQDDVTRRIVDTLDVKLSGAESERLGREGTHSVEAHDMLLRGLERYWNYSRESTAQAAAFYRKAIALDPGYAMAHAWLARACIFQWSMLWRDEDALDEAFEHARKAVALDPNLPFAHSVMCWVQLWQGRSEEAIAAGRRAVALDPNNADAHMFLSLSLASVRRGEEGLGYIETAMRLSPHPSAFYLFALGQCHFALGQYEKAAAAYERGAALSPGFIPNHAFVAITCALLERKDQAAAEAKATLALTGGRKPTVRQNIFVDPAVCEAARRGEALAGLK